MENTLITNPEALYDADVTRILGSMPERRTANSQAVWLDGLSQRDRHLMVFEIFHGQVCNGGFAQWIDNGYHHDLVSMLLLVLQRMDQQVSETLRQVMLSLISRAAAIVANDEPDADDSGCLSEHSYDALEALGSKYYEFSDFWKGEVARYFAWWV